MASNDGTATHQGAEKEIEPESLAHRTTTMSETLKYEDHPERQDNQQQYAHIDEGIARKIAANVDDFMV
jgi:hypothetical protein